MKDVREYPRDFGISPWKKPVIGEAKARIAEHLETAR
jgi:hypothetical protein